MDRICEVCEGETIPTRLIDVFFLCRIERWATLARANDNVETIPIRTAKTPNHPPPAIDEIGCTGLPVARDQVALKEPSPVRTKPL